MSFSQTDVAILSDLLEEFETAQDLTPAEFVDAGLESGNVDEEQAEIFLNFQRHKIFLRNVLQYFCNSNGVDLKKITKINGYFSTLILFYVAIFGLDAGNLQEVADLFRNAGQIASHVMQFFKSESNVVAVVRAACKIYDNDYVLENVANPLIVNVKLIETIYKNISKKCLKTKMIAAEPKATKESDNIINITSKSKHLPPNPTNSIASFKSKTVPKNHYKLGTKFIEKFEDAKKQNKAKALKLLEMARNEAFNCAKIKPISKAVAEIKKPKFTKAVPKFSPVNIKTTNATLMREAALLARTKGDEIKKIEALISGARDDAHFASLEIEIRQAKRQENMQEIERKHLQGLLTYEEAILAKQNFLKANKERLIDFREKRLELLRELEEWKQIEMDKNKALIIKTQSIEKAARDAEKEMIKNKQCNAKMVDFESKRLLKEAQRVKEEELKQKMLLIQELRNLQQISCAHVKEFDRTETANLGLMCEMSVAELQERLSLLKIKMKEELDERRLKIAEEKIKQQQYLENVKEFINESKTIVLKTKTKPDILKLKQTEEIVELKQKLQQARDKRMNLV